MISPETLTLTVREIETPQDLARTAYQYFITASINCPASVSAQGARIAQLARASHHRPEALKLALLGDSRRLKEIQCVASRMHGGSERAPKSVTLEKVKSIVELDFGTAQDLSIALEDQTLVEICTEIYPYYARQKEKFFETWIRDRVDDLMHGRQMQRSWRNPSLQQLNPNLELI